MTQNEVARLEVVEAKLDTLTSKVDQLIIYHQYNERQATDHEQRIRSVERWKLSIPISMLLAIATIVGTMIGR